MKKSNVFIISLFLLCLFVDTHANTTNTQTMIDKEESQINDEKFDHLLEKLTNDWLIPGMSIAVIRNGKIDYCQSFGVKRSNLKDKVNENTIFDAASLTKPVFAYLIMQFVDKGIIDLEKPIIHYLKGTTIMEDYLGKFNYKIEQEGFRKDWFSLITPKHILSHSAGLPHGETYQAKKPDVYPIFFKPGTKFKYSAEGYYILQKIIEHLTGHPVEELMKKYIFTPLNMTDSYMVWTEKIADNAAFGHSAINVPAKELRKAMKSHAGGSLYTTAKDYAKFLSGVLTKKGLTDRTFKMMFEPAVSMENDISYAPGFTVEKSSKGMCCWHTGDYAIFRNLAYANIEEKSGVVFLTNSFYGLGIYPDVLKALFKGDYPILRCDFLKYYRNLDVFKRIVVNLDDALNYFSTDAFRQRSSFKHLELIVDWMADLYKAENKMEPAIKLCNYNTRTFPNSAKAWYWQGDAYMKVGRYDEATRSYKKSLEINPENQNAKKMLKKMEFIKILHFFKFLVILFPILGIIYFLKKKNIERFLLFISLILIDIGIFMSWYFPKRFFGFDQDGNVTSDNGFMGTFLDSIVIQLGFILLLIAFFIIVNNEYRKISDNILHFLKKFSFSHYVFLSGIILSCFGMFIHCYYSITQTSSAKGYFLYELFKIKIKEYEFFIALGFILTLVGLIGKIMHHSIKRKKKFGSINKEEK